MIIVVRPELVADARREMEPLGSMVIEIHPANRDQTPLRLLDLLLNRE
jgi:hypothetical protein